MTAAFLLGTAGAVAIVAGSFVAAVALTAVWDWGRRAAERRRDLREWWEGQGK